MIAAIMQARTGSTRLPWKIMRNLAGKTLLERVLERLSHAKKIDTIIIATTNKKEDKVIEEFCKNTKKLQSNFLCTEKFQRNFLCPRKTKGFSQGPRNTKHFCGKDIKCFRGAEEDVLNRIYKAAEFFKVDIILRATADDPLIDPRNIDEMITSHIEQKADLTYTEGMPLGTGLGMCVISFKALKKADREAKDKRHREHTDEYILDNKEKFKINILKAKPELQGNFRLTVDTEEDFKLMEKICEELDKGEFVNLADVIKLLNKKPELAKINQHVKQK